MLCITTPLNGEQDKKFKNIYEYKFSIDELAPKIYEESSLNNCDKAVTFYTRLVKYLFRKERFKEDHQSNNFYLANIPLRVNKKQYELLVDSDIFGLNIQEIDELVEEVLMQSRNDVSIPQILFDYYCEEIINSLTKFISPVIISISGILFIYILNRLFHFSKLTYSAIILIIILGICAISYTMALYDCQSDLEVEQMIQLSKENSLNNPCKDYHGEHESFFSSVKASLFGSSHNKCLEYMRKTLKPSKKYCDPLDVFAKWSAKIQMSYIGSITGDFLGLIHQFTSSSNIVTKAVIWICCMIFFGYLIISIIQFLIKYGFQGIFGILSTSFSTSNNVTSKDETINLLHNKIDAILYENREMKRELSVIRECSVERSLKNSPASLRKHKQLKSIEEISVDKNDQDDFE